MKPTTHTNAAPQAASGVSRVLACPPNGASPWYVAAIREDKTMSFVKADHTRHRRLSEPSP